MYVVLRLATFWGVNMLSTFVAVSDDVDALLRFGFLPQDLKNKLVEGVILTAMAVCFPCFSPHMVLNIRVLSPTPHFQFIH